jgi:hypothetical protein
VLASSAKKNQKKKQGKQRDDVTCFGIYGMHGMRAQRRDESVAASHCRGTVTGRERSIWA